MTELDLKATEEDLNTFACIYMAKSNYLTSRQDKFCRNMLRFGCTIRLLNEWIVKINNVVIPKGFK